MDGQRRRDLQQELTPAESQGLKACMSSSVWTHSLPMALGSVALLRFIEMKTNYKPKMWAGLAMAVSGAVGGRLLAIPGCVRKVVAENPDGNLTKVLGELNSGKHRNRDSAFASDTSDQILVTDADAVSRPSVSQPPPMQTPALDSPSSNKQTYDDLRRRNREDYVNKKRPSTAAMPDQYAATPVDQAPSGSYYSDTPQSIPSYSDPPSPYMDSQPLIPSSTTDEEPKVRRRKRVNIYGDEIED